MNGGAQPLVWQEAPTLARWLGVSRRVVCKVYDMAMGMYAVVGAAFLVSLGSLARLGLPLNIPPLGIPKWGAMLMEVASFVLLVSFVARLIFCGLLRRPPTALPPLADHQQPVES